MSEGRRWVVIARHDLRRAVALPAAERYRVSLAAAVRAAAAVLAETARPAAVRSGPCGVWSLTAAHAPALREWTDFFALAATRPIGPGCPPIGEREADDLLRDAGEFLTAVEARFAGRRTG
jgi:hypothetical protein